MDISLTILGCNSAKPCFGRHTTSQYLQFKNKAYIIDAGESVQKRITDFGLKPNKIEEIFISHLHGDHILGLPGLLTSFSLSSRTKGLTIYCPPGLETFINSFLKISSSHISYPLHFVHLKDEKISTLMEDKNLKVEAFQVKHRIPTWGFRFTEKISELNINKEALVKYGLTVDEIKLAKAGVENIRDGEITLDEVILPSHKPRSYVYCADTVYSESFLEYAKKADLLYHEATYLEDLKDKAKERMHSTAKEAATFAHKAQVKDLIIGHYSSRYKNLEPLLLEAKEVFDNTLLAEEGKKYTIEKIFSF